MTVLMAELAKAEKEQSAKRALKRNQKEQGGQTAELDGDGKSITDYLQEYQPQTSSGSGKTRETENDLTH
jgi:hypothetical protein